MALVTLSGVINAANLNTNFSDKVAALNGTSHAKFPDKYHQVDIECVGLTSGTNTGINIREFTCPDDMQLHEFGLSVFNPDATSRTVTLTIEAIDPATNTVVSKYLLDQTLSVSVTANSATEFNSARTDWTSVSGTVIFFIKGITYRLTLTSNSGTAVDRAYGFVLLRQKRRSA